MGPKIRAWRQTRGLSQFELAGRAGFSVRHVSFIETGRANPSREAVLALGEALELPLRERNRLFEAAGFAHVFRETPLSANEMAHIRGMLQFILDRHLPYAAVALDRHWNLLLQNRAAGQFFSGLISPGLSAPRAKPNVLRLTFHPEGSRRWIVNWPEVERHLLRSAELDLGSAEDPVGAALLADQELRERIVGARFAQCARSRRPFASDSHTHGRLRTVPVQHHHDIMQAARRHIARTACRDLVPG